MDRKKLEPIKLPNSNMNSNSTSHVESVSTAPSITEDNQNNNNYNDEEPSISENTLSSDKQIINTVKVPKKKVNLDNFKQKNQVFDNKIIFFRNSIKSGRS